jgi:Na+-translocating ferredoxin:NAD+ oxidoreductase subunit G
LAKQLKSKTMAKKESSFINMVLTLFVITAVASVALGYVYNITKDPIQKAKDDKLKAAINIVVPGADKGTIEEKSVSADGGELIFYTVKVNDEIIGTAVKSFSNSAFSGLITVMVGFDKEGKIIDSNVLEHKETPGLGDKTDKKVGPWNEQFKGKDPKEFILKVKKDGGSVDAITAATISSRAYCDAINRAYTAYMETAGTTQPSDSTTTNVEPKDGGNE